jgi:hypothetical protein
VTETKIRCCGYKGEWACKEDYPDHILPIEIFSLDKNKASGRQSRCKGCQKLYDTMYNAKVSEAIKLVGSQKAYRGMTREGRKEIFALLDSNVVDIRPEIDWDTLKLKSEFGQSTPMTKRETTKVEGEAVPQGWVYILQNPACTKPWSLKIGKTFPDGLPDIISSARRFGRAELVDMHWFEEAYKAEQKVHALLNYCNLRTLGYTDCGRELFKCTIQEAVNAITKVQSENDRPSVAVGG